MGRWLEPPPRISVSTDRATVLQRDAIHHHGIWIRLVGFVGLQGGGHLAHDMEFSIDIYIYRERYTYR